MWSIGVKKHAGGIIMIVGVTPDVITFLDDKAGLAKLAGDSLGKHRTCEACTDNKEVKHSYALCYFSWHPSTLGPLPSVVCPSRFLLRPPRKDSRPGFETSETVPNDALERYPN